MSVILFFPHTANDVKVIITEANVFYTMLKYYEVHGVSMCIRNWILVCRPCGKSFCFKMHASGFLGSCFGIALPTPAIHSACWTTNAVLHAGRNSFSPIAVPSSRIGQWSVFTMYREGKGGGWGAGGVVTSCGLTVSISSMELLLCQCTPALL